MTYDKEFWQTVDKLVESSSVVIDRKKGTTHPRYPQFVYTVDYGYLKNTTSPDNSGIDVFVGTKTDKRADAIVCTVDLMKRDSEIKILLGCTEEEKQEVLRLLNDSEYMKGTMIRR